jgi:hypothetical protein
MYEDLVSKLRTEVLKTLHLSLLHTFERDEAIPDGQAKIYGVREFSDWRQLSDAYECELEKRGVYFEKVPW